MSIEAVNWAFSRRGLRPATKLVLVFLADCHNRHTKRCDPAQELLASECEMSRSTINVHLRQLETDGLIRRVQRSDKRTRKQLNTFYVLGFDGDFDPELPDPESGIRTRKSPRAVSGKRPIPCPENGQSRVRTVGHEPELNRKRTARAKTDVPFFTDGERFEAQNIADHIGKGGAIDASAIPDRIRQCILTEQLISQDVASRHGLC